jgi:hypothetical protein
MANIKLTELVGSITGFELFNDSDSFMQDLSEDELDLHGGKLFLPTARLSIFCDRPRPIPTPPILKI